ncbi:hypothetical protein MIMGU_mgv1a016391mg [Erythranthe guttata]|uniref:Uncharacterized protein n=1 Tax=Erythranthe guttata TaxID=4155 RepID=A0A022PW03_ERYGU|nr:hypothetical protein MIMGU_mgv1a016391mg [Erythranthe guttata]
MKIESTVVAAVFFGAALVSVSMNAGGSRTEDMVMLNFNKPIFSSKASNISHVASRLHRPLLRIPPLDPGVVVAHAHRIHSTALSCRREPRRETAAPCRDCEFDPRMQEGKLVFHDAAIEEGNR